MLDVFGTEYANRLSGVTTLNDVACPEPQTSEPFSGPFLLFSESCTEAVGHCRPHSPTDVLPFPRTSFFKIIISCSV